MNRARSGTPFEPPAAYFRARGLYAALVSTSTENRASTPRPHPPQRSGRLLAALLVGSLLLCHGAFGYAHEVSCHECASTDPQANLSQAGHEQGPKHPDGHQGGRAATPASGGPAGGHAAFAVYFGVVLSVFGAAMLGWLLRRWWGRLGDRIQPSRRPGLLLAADGPLGAEIPEEAFGHRH